MLVSRSILRDQNLTELWSSGPFRHLPAPKTNPRWARDLLAKENRLANWPYGLVPGNVICATLIYKRFPIVFSYLKLHIFYINKNKNDYNFQIYPSNDILLNREKRKFRKFQIKSDQPEIKNYKNFYNQLVEK